MYLFADVNDQLWTNVLFVYDTNTNVWSKPTVTGIIPIAAAQFSGNSTCVVNDSFYMLDGLDSDSSLHSQHVYKLDLKSMKWSRVSTTVIKAFSCFVPAFLLYQYFRDNHRCIVKDNRLRQSRTAFSFMVDLEMKY